LRPATPAPRPVPRAPDGDPWSPRTFANEERLPRVPLPTLEDSCRRFLAWCAPLLSPDELAATEAAVADFLRPDSPAHALHAALARFDATPGVHSWLDRFWPARYLGRRDRIALNANFFFLFEDPAGPDDRTEGTRGNGTGGNGTRAVLPQVRRAAGLVAAAVAHKLRLDAEEVPPLVQRGQVTSMVQHRYLFSTTRIPGDVQDAFRAPGTGEPPGPLDARHIVVFHRGNAFRMDVIGPDGRPHSLEDLAEGLDAALKAGAAPAPPDTSVGRLTTKARAEWAASRQRLLAHHPANAEALDVIETALLCLCLEDLTPRDEQEACDVLLHGDSGNRWFDKAVSLVVFADGTAGINVEHCQLDGTTVLGFVESLLGEPPEVHAARAGAVSQGLPALDAIELVLDAELRADVQAAGDAFAEFAARNATRIVAFEGFGSDLAKSLGMSPDAFVQMAYQLAHARAKGRVGATYESIATRQYRHGRTEAMRVVTPEVVRFVAAMDDPGADGTARAAALRAAAQAHVTRTRECQRGDAPEQHLWELQLIQQREGEELGAQGHLALYDSPGWRVMRDDDLSTSSAPSAMIRYFGFGSTSARCIGIGYVLLPDRLKIYLSTPRAEAEGMHRFAAELAAALPQLRDLLAAHPADRPA
jgi:carnitine O-acetyltransferase